MIKRLWYSLLSNDKPQDKNVIWIDTSNSESFTLKLYRNGGWKPLQVVGTSRDMIERELTGYVTSHYHSYDRIINKPTTLEGYGITDCFNKSEIERLLDDKVTKVDGMSLTSNNFSDKYKKMLDNLSTSYYNKKNVDNLLNEKQNVISDLDNIREGAKKGSTALQSFTETDPIYLKDKPFIALKSDLLNDNNFVHKEGDEDIKGAKWFEHIRTNNFSIYQEDNNNHSVYIDYYYDESNYLPILHFSSEEDWLTILDNIADPVDDFHAANKHYVDSKISSTEENLVHKDRFERITAIKQFQKGIGVGLFNTLVANNDGVQSGAWLDQNEDPAPFIVADPSADDHAATKYYVDEGLATKQNTLTDTDGGYGQRVANLEKEGIASQEKLTELKEQTDAITNALADSLPRILRDFGMYSNPTEYVLAVGVSGKYIDKDSALEVANGNYSISQPISLKAGDILLVPSASAVAAACSVVSKKVTNTYDKVIIYAYTYDEFGRINTATADYNTSLVYTAYYESDEQTTPTNWIRGGEHIAELPETHEVTESFYEPLVKQSVAGMPEIGYYVYLASQAMDVVVSAYNATINGGHAIIAGWGIFKNVATNFVGIDKQRVIAEAIADLFAQVEGINEKLTNGLDSLSVKHLHIDRELSGLNIAGTFCLQGAGVPSASVVPVNWDFGRYGDWKGIPQFIGQEYFDTIDKVFYKAHGVTAVSNWKRITNA